MALARDIARLRTRTIGVLVHFKQDGLRDGGRMAHFEFDYEDSLSDARAVKIS